jgi:AraC family transcriptional regulator, regulatory protein of adaptative response / DNA-3-methyladenine glycosylase II
MGQDGVMTTTLPATRMPIHRDHERCYRAVSSRDARFDGVFYIGVHTTGIYCRPSCPARTPKRENVSFYATAAAAHSEGFRACRRCRPDATPGSPEWDARADVVGRAIRLIRDGVVEREGVAGLANRLGYSDRHINRLLHAELGAGPLALARAQRAHTARILAETTGLPLADVAFAAGFSSIRQFNDTMREIYGLPPRELRRTHRRAPGPEAIGKGRLRLKLAVRQPYDADQVLAFLAARAVPGIEAADAESYSRILSLPGGPGVVRLEPHTDRVDADLWLTDMRDLGTAVQRCRALTDLDADPRAVTEVLGPDAELGELIAARPGTRVPGHVDGFEIGVRAVLGQQVTVAHGRALAQSVVEKYGTQVIDLAGWTGPGWTFPTPDAVAGADPASFGVPKARGRAVVALAEAMATGELRLDPGADRDETARALRALPGIGPWTAGYIGMRALSDPDVFLGGDVIVRHAMRSLGLPATATGAETHATRWRPWRSYAVVHLWRHHQAADPRPSDQTVDKEHR